MSPVIPANQIVVTGSSGPWKDGGSIRLWTNVGSYFIDNRCGRKPRGLVRHVGARVKYGYDGRAMGKLLADRTLGCVLLAAYAHYVVWLAARRTAVNRGHHETFRRLNADGPTPAPFSS